MDEHAARRIADGVAMTSLADLRLSLVNSVIRYTRLRLQWKDATPEQRLAMDAGRTRAHDAFIDACNILSRNMARIGENIAWREMLGVDRKTIGDFACWLFCFENSDGLSDDAMTALCQKALSAR